MIVAYNKPIEIKLDVKPIYVKCEKCGVDNRYYTLPLDNVYKCNWCNDRKDNDSFLSNLFSSNPSSRFPSWALAGVVIAVGFTVYWYYFKHKRKR